eukprot:4621362-Prymnesium_polylepis.1
MKSDLRDAIEVSWNFASSTSTDATLATPPTYASRDNINPVDNIDASREAPGFSAEVSHRRHRRHWVGQGRR